MLREKWVKTREPVPKKCLRSVHLPQHPQVGLIWIALQDARLIALLRVMQKELPLSKQQIGQFARVHAAHFAEVGPHRADRNRVKRMISVHLVEKSITGKP